MTLITCPLKEFLSESKLNGFWGVFCYIGLRIFHMGGEVK